MWSHVARHLWLAIMKTQFAHIAKGRGRKRRNITKLAGIERDGTAGATNIIIKRAPTI